DRMPIAEDESIGPSRSRPKNAHVPSLPRTIPAATLVPSRTPEPLREASRRTTPRGVWPPSSALRAGVEKPRGRLSGPAGPPPRPARERSKPTVADAGDLLEG